MNKKIEKKFDEEWNFTVAPNKKKIKTFIDTHFIAKKDLEERADFLLHTKMPSDYDSGVIDLKRECLGNTNQDIKEKQL